MYLSVLVVVVLFVGTLVLFVVIFQKLVLMNILVAVESVRVLVFVH